MLNAASAAINITVIIMKMFVNLFDFNIMVYPNNIDASAIRIGNKEFIIIGLITSNDVMYIPVMFITLMNIRVLTLSFSDSSILLIPLIADSSNTKTTVTDCGRGILR